MSASLRRGHQVDNWSRANTVEFRSAGYKTVSISDAELLRVRVHTYTDLDARAAGFRGAANWPAARTRLFELRSAKMISSQAANPPCRPH